MTTVDLYFSAIDYRFPMIFVKGSGNNTWQFGERDKTAISTKDFYISQYPVTQRLWEYIMGHNPAFFKGENKPVEVVSFHEITGEKGFLDQLNSGNGNKFQSEDFVFRLPSETEWEYAARGGIHWTDGFIHSGSNDLDEVGWFELNSGKYSDPAFVSRLKNHEKGTTTKDVGLKSPNQLGIFDMCGNVWEWCHDHYQRDIHQIPNNGSPFSIPTGTRVLRGGCHHNGAIHCTVSKRYEIIPDAKDECIGFRIAASAR